MKYPDILCRVIIQMIFFLGCFKFSYPSTPQCGIGSFYLFMCSRMDTVIPRHAREWLPHPSWHCTWLLLPTSLKQELSWVSLVSAQSCQASSKAPIVIPSKAVGPVITGPTPQGLSIRGLRAGNLMAPLRKAEPAMPQALLQQQQRPCFMTLARQPCVESICKRVGILGPRDRPYLTELGRFMISWHL